MQPSDMPQMDQMPQMPQIGPVGIIIYVAVIVILIAACWKIFSKAGKPGWACIIPIYNIIVMLDIIKRPVWWIILMLIPIVNIVIMIIVAMDLASAFGKGKGWGFLMLVILGIIGYPILGFGGASYTAPSREVAQATAE